MARYEGTVHWFNNAKGCGFLGLDDGPDVFVHFSSVQQEASKILEEGKPVEHEIARDRKGQRANPALPSDSKN